MPESQIRLDIRDAPDLPGFIWAVQKTTPVVTLFVSAAVFPSRAVALSNFQNVCSLLGWNNDITEVPVQ